MWYVYLVERSNGDTCVGSKEDLKARGESAFGRPGDFHPRTQADDTPLPGAVETEPCRWPARLDQNWLRHGGCSEAASSR